ncbi:mitochondrial fission 1 protein [Nannochloropsis oceanica]
MTVKEDREHFALKLQAEAKASLEQIPEKEAAWEAERKNGNPDLNAKFIYAYVLCMSASDRHKKLGIRLMNELITARFNVEECLYATAVCLYSQGEWQGARDKVDRLLRLNPDHRYGNELHLYVKDAQAKQDLAVGVGVGVGVLGATAAILLGAFLGGGRRGR